MTQTEQTEPPKLSCEIHSNEGIEVAKGYVRNLNKGTKFKFSRAQSEPLNGVQLKGPTLIVHQFSLGPDRFEIIDFERGHHPWIAILHVKKLPEAGPAPDEEPAFNPGRSAVF